MDSGVAGTQSAFSDAEFTKSLTTSLLLGSSDSKADEKTTSLLTTLAGLSAAAKAQAVTQMGRDSALHAAVCTRLLLARSSSAQQDNLVCQWLYELYTGSQSSAAQRRFVLQFAPCLVWGHLSRPLGQTAGLAAVLLAIANTELASAAAGSGSGGAGAASSASIFDKPQLPPVGVPLLAVSTPYSAPTHYDAKGSVLTEAALAAHLKGRSKQSSASAAAASVESKESGSSAAAAAAAAKDALSAAAVVGTSWSNSLLLAHVCLAKYCSAISHMSLPSLQQFCCVAARLADIGAEGDVLAETKESLSWVGTWNFLAGPPAGSLAAGAGAGAGEKKAVRAKTRFLLSTPLLEDLLIGTTFCLSHPHTQEVARVALNQLHLRATNELLSDLLLSTTSLLEQPY